MDTFIAERCSDLPVAVCCLVMKVSTSGFYKWCAQPVLRSGLERRSAHQPHRGDPSEGLQAFLVRRRLYRIYASSSPGQWSVGNNHGNGQAHGFMKVGGLRERGGF